MGLITPRTLKGFRDYLPEVMIPRERLMETARKVYRSYGFSPIDTPALEYLEILQGKGSDETDKQLYKFEDHGGRSVGMRFDLTVPLARFTAQHVAELPLPFKRYHIATVWRGENTQRGRYREFMQCDFDTIGTLAVGADIETGLVIHDLMRAIGFMKFHMHINNRMVLNGFLDKWGIRDRSVPVLRALDKLAKIGPEKVIVEMVEAAQITPEQAEAVLDFAAVSGPADQVLAKLPAKVAGSEQGEAGVQRLAELVAGMRAAGVAEEVLELDVSIARGLDYYTGVIFETTLDELPGLGSVCSGGRYDNLAGLFTTQQLPGIGASLGLDRLLAGMEELGLTEKTATTAPVFIPFFEKDRQADYLRLAAALRLMGIGCELYPEPKKLSVQLKYADRRGFRAAIIAGGNEFDGKFVQLKNLTSGEKSEVPIDEGLTSLMAVLRTILVP